MGNVLSSGPTRERDVDNVTSESETMGDTNVLSDDSIEENHSEDCTAAGNHEDAQVQAKEEEMVQFRRQLTIKREQRREILARHRAEKEELEKSLQKERESKLELYENNRLLRELLSKNNIDIPEELHSSSENAEIADVIMAMKNEFENLKSSNIKLRRDLADTNSSLQEANSDIAELNSQNRESIKQINALKDVVSASKTMINLREQQLNDLKNKLNEIERTLADRETNLLSADLRQEYERQLQNIRTLRGLYEERARLAEVTRQGLVRELDEHKILYQTEVKKCKDLTTRVEELEEKVDSLLETIDNKNIQISSCRDETNVLKAEMTVVNKLFSQVLLGYKTKQDLDKLVHRLEENHGLLTQMAEKENDGEVSSALPKLLLELVSQVEEKEEKENKTNEGEEPLPTNTSMQQVQNNESASNTTAEEIVENLPKVWKVLIELLSHQNVSEDTSSEKVTTCYKSVETKSGPVLVPSVSQTYIRLKDLIVEKLGLIKEVNRMKQLNEHLGTRLEEQEKRLCLVTNELSKTWHVVGRLRRHHHQLHTHEKILKYELQQKRKLLNELKEELEYCREKWDQAREKNTQSERDWKKLRAEFSSRKTKSGSPSFNNSGESGYSDEKPSDESSESNDESEYVAEPLVRCKKKMKKSFETILDSSTDFNLAAEREDPASDMLDVADLPLDAQESEENREPDSGPSESIHKNVKSFEETEDEVGDMTHDDSYADESITELNCMDNSGEILEEISPDPNEKATTSTEMSSSMPVNDSADIMRTVLKQNERLAIRDKEIITKEYISAATSQNTRNTSESDEQTNNALVLVNLPTSSIDLVDDTKKDAKNINARDISNTEGHATALKGQEIMDNNENIDSRTDNKESPNYLSNPDIVNKPDTLSQIAETQLNKILQQQPNIEQKAEIDSTNITESVQIAKVHNVPDFKAILENVKKQNERLAKKDERLQQMENTCSKVVSTIKSTLETGDKLINKMDSLHNEQQCFTSESSTNVPDNSELQEEATQSTSNEIDHEARFAARDLRLKRLEEQTKSLVNKVNKTTSKGIKINYKLEELHNIYGSESSRAGTPSEDTEDKTNEEESNDE